MRHPHITHLGALNPPTVDGSTELGVEPSVPIEVVEVAGSVFVAASVLPDSGHLVAAGALDRSTAVRLAERRGAITRQALACLPWLEEPLNRTIKPEDLGLPPAQPGFTDLWVPCHGLLTGQQYSVPARSLLPCRDGDLALNLVDGDVGTGHDAPAATQDALQRLLARDLITRWWRRPSRHRRPLLPADDLLLEALPAPVIHDLRSADGLSVSAYILQVATSCVVVVLLRCDRTDGCSIAVHLVEPWTIHEALRRAFIAAVVRRAITTDALRAEVRRHSDSKSLVRKWLIGPQIQEELRASCVPVRPLTIPRPRQHLDLVDHVVSRFGHEPVVMSIETPVGTLAAACCPGAVTPPSS